MQDLETAYFRELRNVRILSRDEIIAMWPEVKKGNKAARDMVAKSSAKFVISVANKYRKSGAPLLDLVAEGNLGLFAAMDRFDPSRGNAFISYAVWWVRQYIDKYMETLNLIRSPSGIHLIARRVVRALGKGVEITEIKEFLQCSETKAGSVWQHLRNESVTSLDIKVGDSDSTSLVEMISAEDSAIDELAQEDMRTLIRKASSTLSSQERSVVTEIYLSQDGGKHKLKDVALRMGVSSERVRQILSSGLRKMNRYLNSEFGQSQGAREIFL